MKPMQKMSSWDMCNPSSIEKLKIECIEEEDGSMTIHIEWDENDQIFNGGQILAQKVKKSL
jgi:hypothetical protein